MIIDRVQHNAAILVRRFKFTLKPPYAVVIGISLWEFWTLLFGFLSAFQLQFIGFWDNLMSFGNFVNGILFYNRNNPYSLETTCWYDDLSPVILNKRSWGGGVCENNYMQWRIQNLQDGGGRQPQRWRAKLLLWPIFPESCMTRSVHCSGRLVGGCLPGRLLTHACENIIFPQLMLQTVKIEPRRGDASLVSLTVDPPMTCNVNTHLPSVNI